MNTLKNNDEEYQERLKKNRTEKDLKELRGLYAILKKVEFDEFSDFQKNVFAIKSKLFSKWETEKEKFEKIISIIDEKIEDFKRTLSGIKNLENFKKSNQMYYTYDDLIDENGFYYEDFIRFLEKLRQIFENDFSRFWCIFIDEEWFEKKIYKLESYCMKKARINKILFVANMNWDTEVSHYDFDEYMDEMEEIQKQKDITKK